jgi:hypothetical protein
VTGVTWPKFTRPGHPARGTVSIWKQWLIIAVSVLLSPVVVLAVACAFGWELVRRLWPRHPRSARQLRPQ